jgi:hypothetical protein
VNAQFIFTLWRVAALLVLLGITAVLTEARLGQGEPHCGFSATLGGRHNVYWCGSERDRIAEEMLKLQSITGALPKK